MLRFNSGKKYTHSEGLSCTYRNWRATHSHCRLLHGYSLSFEFWFERRDRLVNDLYWVQDFGALKPLKEWLKSKFDHKLVLAVDDPEFHHIQALEHRGIAEITIVRHTGCEAFAELALLTARSFVDQSKVMVVACEVAEHEGNTAVCYERDTNNERYRASDNAHRDNIAYRDDTAYRDGNERKEDTPRGGIRPHNPG